MRLGVALCYASASRRCAARRVPQLEQPLDQVRLDTLWAQELSQRTIDFIKVDIDSSWYARSARDMLSWEGCSTIRIRVFKVRS